MYIYCKYLYRHLGAYFLHKNIDQVIKRDQHLFLRSDNNVELVNSKKD